MLPCPDCPKREEVVKALTERLEVAEKERDTWMGLARVAENDVKNIQREAEIPVKLLEETRQALSAEVERRAAAETALAQDKMRYERVYTRCRALEQQLRVLRKDVPKPPQEIVKFTHVPTGMKYEEPKEVKKSKWEKDFTKT